MSLEEFSQPAAARGVGALGAGPSPWFLGLFVLCFGVAIAAMVIGMAQFWLIEEPVTGRWREERA